MFRWLLPLLLLSSSALIRAEAEEEEAGDNATELVVETLEKPESCVDTVAHGDTIQLHYTGRLDDGRVIDSSLSRDPLVVEIGKKQVIPGLEESLIGMCVGEKRKVIIPPHLAYGKRGYPPSIPGDAVLQFETEVISLSKPTQWQTFVNKVLPLLCIGLVPTLLGLIGYHLYSKSKSPAVSKKKLKEEKRNKAKKK
ncbi:peptidyl-prolyl cis-trans isomerase FKBP11 [Spea bombifrons]|uniref:peptidyl-prolyl cis-trans isomerase FKBP11 n=1 Tax=Spea bombifrons TaxID=233779 RepID=UPI00234B94DE|nr:peptidyl-prolyl cis-trans isomerase FKBP11 [Spea bombifrons]